MDAILCIIMKGILLKLLANRKMDERTLRRMHHLFCRNFHNSQRLRSPLCQSCKSLLDYSLKQTDACKWKKLGRLCSNCNVHCFEESKRQEILQVMKFAGPRLLLTNPFLAIRYLLQKSMQGRFPSK